MQAYYIIGHNKEKTEAYVEPVYNVRDGHLHDQVFYTDREGRVYPTDCDSIIYREPCDTVETTLRGIYKTRL